MKSIIAILADEKNSIPYRPQIAKHFESVACAILLQQIIYWWVKSGCKPFFKFKEPCEHQHYRQGDSWLEELGIARREFDRARDAIAKKSINSYSSIGLRYWVDYNRLTWYDVNEDAMAMFLNDVYVKCKVHVTYSAERTLPNGESARYVKCKVHVSNKVTETTQRLPETNAYIAREKISENSPEDDTDATSASIAWWWRNVICLLYEKMTLPYPGELGENEIKRERIAEIKKIGFARATVGVQRALCDRYISNQGYSKRLVISQLVRFAPTVEEIEAYGFTWKAKALQADLVALAMGEYQGEHRAEPEPGRQVEPSNCNEEDLPF